jgi:hypothetical protein
LLDGHVKRGQEIVGEGDKFTHITEHSALTMFAAS